MQTTNMSGVIRLIGIDKTVCQNQQRTYVQLRTEEMKNSLANGQMRRLACSNPRSNVIIYSLGALMTVKLKKQLFYASKLP